MKMVIFHCCVSFWTGIRLENKAIGKKTVSNTDSNKMVIHMADLPTVEGKHVTHPKKNRGHYITNPSNAQFLGHIPQNYHRFASSSIPAKWVPFNDRWQNPSITTPSFPSHNACCSINATTETRLGFKQTVGKTEHFQWPSIPLKGRFFFFGYLKNHSSPYMDCECKKMCAFFTILNPESLGVDLYNPFPFIPL